MDRYTGLSGPGAGERVRTVLAVAPTIDVEIDGRWRETVARFAVEPDGSLVLLVAAHGDLATAECGVGARCAVRAARVSPLRSPDRVVDQVVVGGRLRLHPDVAAGMDVLLAGLSGDPSPALPPDEAVLLRIDVRAVSIGGETVAVTEYAAARCDPFATVGDEMVAHMAAHHARELQALAPLLGDPAAHQSSITPVCVDRFGITLLVGCAAEARRARVDFRAPVRCMREMAMAMQDLQRQAARAPAGGTVRE